MDTYNKIKKYLCDNYPLQSEYHQAVLHGLGDILEGQDWLNEKELEVTFKRLIEPDRILSFKIEWFDDQSRLQINKGFRVQFNNSLGPYKGGLRFHPTVNESVLKFLGYEQIFKNALTGFPIGGAKGGSDFNPKGRSENEILRFCQAFMTELHRNIGHDEDIPAGDIGVGTREIGFLFGHYLKLTRSYSGAMTGKHPNFGGSCGREEATGYGCVYFLKNILEHQQKGLEGHKAIVSGSGNVALHTVEKLIDFNVLVLTLSDSKGALYFSQGINKGELNYIKERKINSGLSLKQIAESSQENLVDNIDYKEGEKPWSIDGDFYFPCATQNEISGEDMKKILNNEPIALVEGSNMPLTSEASDLVEKSDILYAPGKASNAGGVAVSNMERTQNATKDSYSMERIEADLQEVMTTIHSNCLKYLSEKDKFNYKKGANLYGFRLVSQAMSQLGGKVC